VKQQTTVDSPQSTVLAQGNLLKNVITSLREARNRIGLKPKEKIDLFIGTSNNQENFETYLVLRPLILKQVNIGTIAIDSAETSHLQLKNCTEIVIGKDKFIIQTPDDIFLDKTAQKETLEKDLAYQKGFLESVMKKLGNERFVANAKPEVIAAEQKKKADAEARIKTIEESLANL
jgi:valyl-tRNA synthetase